jgi:hypothetical protein
MKTVAVLFHVYDTQCDEGGTQSKVFRVENEAELEIAIELEKESLKGRGFTVNEVETMYSVIT